jgi:hypothetical protein
MIGYLSGMSRILNSDSGNTSAERLGANRIFVRGLPYDNTAAKFWSALIDEVLGEYPACDEIVLRGSSGGLLSPELLNPEASLQRELDRLKDVDLRKTFDEIVAAMEVLGPPCGVVLSLRVRGVPLASRELPLDCLDAEILPFLLAWLLEWANLAEFAWNGEHVKGEFAAEDRERHLRYRIAFQLANRHLSEGLFDRELDLAFQRQIMRQTAQKS